jgi:hypothetical protein
MGMPRSILGRNRLGVFDGSLVVERDGVADGGPVVWTHNAGNKNELAAQPRVRRQVPVQGWQAARSGKPPTPRGSLVGPGRRLSRGSRFGVNQWTWGKPTNTAISALG